jgi:tetratricopeptide (TPR) repeat protein
MGGCLRKLGIALGVLVVLAAVGSLAFWLNWRRGNELSGQARDAYSEGRAAEALASYQGYIHTWGLGEHEVQIARSRMDELEGYLEASSLQQNGQVDESVAAYSAFLDDHSAWKAGFTPWATPYYFLAGQALVNLKAQQAEQLSERGDFAKAIEVYESLVALQPLTGDNCTEASLEGATMQGLCQEAEAAIQEFRASALAAVPAVLLEWAQALDQGGNVLEFVKRCESILAEHRQLQSGASGAQVLAALDKARAELPAWLEVNPAVAELEYAQEVTRDSEDVWVLTTRLREVGGKVGYTVKGSGWIIDAQGEKWQTYGLSEIDRGSVTVPAGGETENTYRLRGDPFVDGDAFFHWEGEDEGGHAIDIEEQVHLLP